MSIHPFILLFVFLYLYIYSFILPILPNTISSIARAASAGNIAGKAHNRLPTPSFDNPGQFRMTANSSRISEARNVRIGHLLPGVGLPPEFVICR
jgi:hypothetical protein